MMSSVERELMTMPTTLDQRLLTIYLTDHLAAATGVVRRLQRMKDSYTDLPVHTEIAALARDVAADRDRLRAFIAQLGLPQRRRHQLLARAGEAAGRLKLNGRLTSRSPLTPLLEMELLSGGITGKRSLWRTLAEHSGDLSLDREELARLEQAADQQLETVERCRQVLAASAFRRE